MTRLIILLALVIVAIYFVRRTFLVKPPASDKRDVPGKTADMIRCELCGLHVPRAEAVVRNNHNYCCEDHANRANH
ncbi:MAG: hypothetical protein HY272_06395 [Gammaproteobacteria bacterium]|nr:hypothetical protein [Gammaproteobacteria bacterium]